MRANSSPIPPAQRRRRPAHPQALALLALLGIPTLGLRSKPWEEVFTARALQHDVVITVCDNAVGEGCPVWPGQPMTAFWDIPNPAPVLGSAVEVAMAFNDAYQLLYNRL